jgi:hypothetical protein
MLAASHRSPSAQAITHLAAAKGASPASADAENHLIAPSHERDKQVLLTTVRNLHGVFERTCGPP